MPEQIYIGNFPKGQINIREPFVINNDSFPYMFNFYTWRGQARRKRGTGTLARLQKQFKSVLNAAPPNQYQVGQFFTLNGAGAGSGNLITTYASSSTTASIVPGSINLSDGTNTYAEASIPDGTLVGTPAGTGTINYATGAVTITGGAAAGVVRGGSATVSFSIYLGLPAMGARDLVPGSPSTLYPLTMCFDTQLSYQINQNGTPFFYNVTYYKSTNTPFVWSGQDYQQFYTTNYANALWATNGKSGFHFQNIQTITVGNPTTITTAAPHGLITGDYVWFNEITGANASLLNGQAFSITKTGANTFTVAVNTTAMALNSDGIFQTLTASKSGQDGIKWYDGDPTNGTGIPTGSANLGWVNFAPPLTAATVSINNLPEEKYYLVGAQLIAPFKGRLLFFNVYVQTSTGPPIQLQDTVICSQVGTPYYTVGPSGTDVLVPANETAALNAWYVDQTGLGDWISAGISQPITTLGTNEDVLLVGFGGSRGRKTRFIYTGNDLDPFRFFNINSELPSDATFSAVNLDKGTVDLGPYGIALTDQQSATRIDLDIPDEVFQIQADNNGMQRINSLRDFKNEWIYFSYPTDTSDWKFPTQTFLFNYRDNTWAIQYENYTCHGNFRPSTGYTWNSLPYATWNDWNESWASGSSISQYPHVIAGNPQGYFLTVGIGTGEGISGDIKAIANDGNGNTQITSPNHCVTPHNPGLDVQENGDYLYIQGMIGATSINNMIGKVISTPDANTFVIDLPYPGAGYLGLGTFTRLSQPLIQTKQFNPYWDQGKKARLAAQRYLLDSTPMGQVTVNIYLSQDDSSVWNSDPIVPDINAENNALVYTQLMYTCQESTNIGLTAANTNLQMPTAEFQQKIWHRFNTSLIGDTVQIGLTLSDAQMRNLTYATSEITLHGVHLVVEKGPMLA